MARLPQDDIDADIDADIDDQSDENAEQTDEGQAQDIAQDALGRTGDLSEDSDKPHNGDRYAITPDDTPDLVDKMDEMVRSGHIDNDAFAGEPMHDDEEDRLGATDDDLDDDT